MRAEVVAVRPAERLPRPSAADMSNPDRFRGFSGDPRSRHEIPVAERMFVDRPKSSARDQPAGRAEASARYLTDSHFVAVTLSAGWLTRRCHTTAARPSVWGVMRSG